MEPAKAAAISELPGAWTPAPGKMTPRERFRRTFLYESVDRLPNLEMGFWNETLPLWHNQGLPREVDNFEKAKVYFGLDPITSTGVRYRLCPLFEEETLEERGGRKLVRSEQGEVCEILTDGSSSIPHFVRFAVETEADWEKLKKERLDPENPARFPANWAERVAREDKREHALEACVGSLFGWPRYWLGFENLMLAYYDRPGLITAMLEHIEQLSISVIEKALPGIVPEFPFFWEDMAYNTGPMISPELFREHMLPRYARIVEVLRRHGVRTVGVDCDGNIDALLPLWLEAGVNCMYPMEQAAGADPVRYRKEYGKAVVMRGGVEKRELMKDRAAVDRELERLRPLAEEGGFIPHLDHWVPPDISYDSFRYYLERKRKVFGME